MNKSIRKWLTITFDIIFLPLFTLSLFDVGLTVYLFDQAKGQLKIIYFSEKVNDLKRERKFTSDQIKQLELIQEIKTYSVEKLNFNPSSSYTSFYDQKNKSILWTVTACEPYQFKSYEWKFPFLGNLSYKGYFDTLKAVEEREKLKGLGYDSDISSIQAWSTLGFFDDPIFSEMLKKPKAKLTELIFHELFHGTIYAPGAVELNENLAAFIAKKATFDFLNSDTMALKEYREYLENEKKMNFFIRKCVNHLNTCYHNFNLQKTSKKEKEKRKGDQINTIVNELMRTNFISNSAKLKISKRIIESGNAFFMHYKRYNAKEDSLENIYREKFKGNLSLMILDIKNNISSL